MSPNSMRSHVTQKSKPACDFRNKLGQIMRSATHKSLSCFPGLAKRDLISQLPEPIIGHILGFMPLPDAARTSVLSREWRFKWFHVSRIDCGTRDNEAAGNRLFSGILRLLRDGDGALPEFCLAVTDELKSCSEIDEILKLVYKKDVRKIFFGAQKGMPHTLDPSLFSCSQLAHLVLRNCVLKPPPEFTGFTKLVTLSLYDVPVSAQLLLTLISQSPMLEVLWLATSHFATSDRLEVTAPNLRNFHCHAHFKTLISVVAPRLNDMTMVLPIHRTDMKNEVELTSVRVLKSVDSTVRLHLDYYYMKCLHRNGLRVKLENLRFLRLSGICFGIAHEVECVLELMTSCASLETVIIEVATVKHDDDDVTFSGLLDFYRCRIREIQMLDISGSKNELAFIKTLLLKLLKLETMVIAPGLKHGVVVRDNVSKFRHTSRLATIKFRDSADCKASLHCRDVQCFD